MLTMSYEERCNEATTDQGLDPIVGTLRAAGIRCEVDQTGGFCMCVRVPLAEGFTPYAYVTRGDDVGEDDTPLCVVGVYWDCGGDCDGMCGDYQTERGAYVPNCVTLADLPGTLRRLVGTVGPCPYCAGVA